MAEINACTLMFNLGPEDAIDSTTSAKIARYTERKQLAYKLTDEGVLLLDGRYNTSTGQLPSGWACPSLTVNARHIMLNTGNSN